MIPPTARALAVAAIKDYKRQCILREEIIFRSKQQEEGGGNYPGNPTERLALSLLRLNDNTQAVEKSLAALPVDYRKPTYNLIVKREWTGPDTPKELQRQYKKTLIYLVAKNMGLLGK